MLSFQNADSGGISRAVSDEDKYILSNVVETKMLYLSTRSTQCTQLNGDMKSHVSFDLKSYLDFAGDDSIHSITLSMPYAILVNSNYQINSTNNTLKYEINGNAYTIRVPSGNYTTETFIPVMIDLFNVTSGIGFNIILNQTTATFTFTHTTYTFQFLSTSTINYVLGFTNVVVSSQTPPFPQVDFLGNISGGSNVITLVTSPQTPLVVGNTVAYYDPNTGLTSTTQITEIGANTFTLLNPLLGTSITNGVFVSGPNYGLIMPRVCNFLPNPLFRICIENNSMYNGQVLGSAGNPQFSNVLASIPNVTKQNTQIVYQNFSDEFAIQPSGQTSLILAILDDNNNFVDFNGISSYFQLRIRLYRRIKKSLKSFGEVLGGATNLRNIMVQETEDIKKPIHKIL